MCTNWVLFRSACFFFFTIYVFSSIVFYLFFFSFDNFPFLSSSFLFDNLLIGQINPKVLPYIRIGSFEKFYSLFLYERSWKYKWCTRLFSILSLVWNSPCHLLNTDFVGPGKLLIDYKMRSLLLLLDAIIVLLQAHIVFNTTYDHHNDNHNFSRWNVSRATLLIVTRFTNGTCRIWHYNSLKEDKE